MSLTAQGYHVLEALDRQQAMQVASTSEQVISLLIVDHSVPHEAGRDIVDDLLRMQPGAAVLRTSGQIESDMRERGLMLPGSSFLQKPFLPKELVARVAELLASNETGAATSA